MMDQTATVRGAYARTERRWRGHLAGLVAAAALMAAGVVTVVPAYASDSAADRTFKSLDEAAEAGAIDATTVTALRKGRKVQAFAILEGEAAATAYGTGDK